MKYIIKSFLCSVSLFASLFMSQENVLAATNSGNVPISLYLRSAEDFSSEDVKWLEKNLSEALKLNNMELTTSDANSRFMMLGDVKLLSSDVYPSVPPKNIVKVEVNLYVYDAVDNIVHQQGAMVFRAVSQDEQSAISRAVRSFNARNAKLKRLIVFGMEKVEEYNRAQGIDEFYLSAPVDCCAILDSIENKR